MGDESRGEQHHQQCRFGEKCHEHFAAGDWQLLPAATLVLVGKLLLAGAGLALLETVSAKMRIFRAPEFLGMAFLLGVLGMLTHFLLER